jgi:hypothetical protein
MNMTELLIPEKEALELLIEEIYNSRTTYYEDKDAISELMYHLESTCKIMHFVSDEDMEAKFQVDISSSNERLWLYVEVEKIARRYFGNMTVAEMVEMKDVDFDNIKPKESLEHVPMSKKMFVVTFDDDGVINKTKEIKYDESLLIQ